MELFRYLSFAAFAGTALSLEAHFYYSPVEDACEWSSQSFVATDNSLHGGVCAYVPGTNRLYACPAPDPTCWGWYQTCKSGSNAGNNQILCNSSGYTWCCTSDESCTTTPGQINVCISNFTSPNSGISTAVANSKEYAALGVSTVTASTQTANPTPFSTQTFLITSTSSTSSSSSSKTTASTSSSSVSTSSSSTLSTSTSASTPSSTGTAAGSNTSNTSSPTPSASSSGSSGLSGGAIAGIVIGVVALLAALAAGFYFLGRRKRSARSSIAGATEASAGTPPGVGEKSWSLQYGHYSEMATPPMSNTPQYGMKPGMGTQELPASGHSASPELPGSNTGYVGRHEMAG